MQMKARIHANVPFYYECSEYYAQKFPFQHPITREDDQAPLLVFGCMCLRCKQIQSTTTWQHFQKIAHQFPAKKGK